MKPYINITGTIVIEVRDRHTDNCLWAYEDVTSINHDKYYFYIYKANSQNAIKISKGAYRLGIRGKI